MRRRVLFGLIFLLPAIAAAQQTPATDAWGPYKFLIATWGAPAAAYLCAKR